MKRMIYIMAIVTVVLNLTACQSSSQQDTNDPVLEEVKKISITTAETKTDQEVIQNHLSW